MNISNDISNRITVLRFPLIIGVVYVHAYSVRDVEAVNGEVGHIALFVQNLISQSLVRMAVPLLFILAGFLLFQRYELSVNSVKAKLGSRIKSLLIPFLFWNIACLLFFALIQSLPFLSSFFSEKSDRICAYDTYDYFASIFGLGRMPIVYQFWFIRDLMILVIISPIVLLLAKRLPKISFLFLFTLWFGSLKQNSPFVSVFFFFTGSLLAVYDFKLAIIDGKSKWFTWLFVLLVFVETATMHYDFNRYLHKIAILVGICVAWIFAKYICKFEKAKSFCTFLSGYSFFCVCYTRTDVKDNWESMVKAIGLW